LKIIIYEDNIAQGNTAILAEQALDNFHLNIGILFLFLILLFYFIILYVILRFLILIEINFFCNLGNLPPTQLAKTKLTYICSIPFTDGKIATFTLPTFRYFPRYAICGNYGYDDDR
jgi:hypothetical protein